MPLKNKRNRLLHIARWLGVVPVILTVTADPASAGPLACGGARDAADKAIVAAAEAHFASHWRKSSSGWSTAYQFKPEPKNPFAVSPFRTAQEETAPQAALAGPLGGIAAVDGTACTFYELHPEAGFVVRFVGRGLRFSENGGRPSSPIGQALIAAYVVQPAPAGGAPYKTFPLPDARTALAPDMVLSLPPETAPLEGKRR